MAVRWSRRVEAGWLRCHSFWLGVGPGPGSSVGRAPAASAGVPGSIPGGTGIFSLRTCWLPFLLLNNNNNNNNQLKTADRTVSACWASSVQCRDLGKTDTNANIYALHIFNQEEGSQNRLNNEKSQKGKSTRRDSNLWHRFA